MLLKFYKEKIEKADSFDLKNIALDIMQDYHEGIISKSYYDRLVDLVIDKDIKYQKGFEMVDKYYKELKSND